MGGHRTGPAAIFRAPHPPPPHACLPGQSKTVLTRLGKDGNPQTTPATTFCQPSREPRRLARKVGDAARRQLSAATRALVHSEQSPGRSARPGHGGSRVLSPRLRPWPLPPARVGSSTPLFGSERTREVLSAQGTDAAINLRASPPSAAHWRVFQPGLASPAHRGTLLSRSLCRESSQEVPVHQREGIALPSRYHHQPSPRVPDPEAAAGSPITALGRGTRGLVTSSQEGLLRLGWVCSGYGTTEGRLKVGNSGFSAGSSAGHLHGPNRGAQISLLVLTSAEQVERSMGTNHDKRGLGILFGDSCGGGVTFTPS
ncbi:PREDICTED: uncharacterized protein LOC102019576 [Chinchilla lanigera]|uniref:uncharacterized protein LOC102019576 n=1 Tax=Chinchilla lanigera TaxID=34839 RepID=UPI0006985D2A|nr:PREDICTED: uncharacterized protein LOC102019576 [Chinchilla lanigera]